MKHPRMSRALALLGAALLLASIVAPWLTLYNIWARPEDQWLSPASVLWYALRSTPYSMNGAEVVTMSLIYIGVTLAFVVAVAALTRASQRPGKRFATAALVVVIAMIPYFIITSLSTLFIQFALEMSDGGGFSGETLSVGAACVVLGGLCAIIGLTDMSR
ncbi:MAG: hypothetical protein ACHQ1E_07295 [Ktedonobacterales bacterium]